MNLYMVEVWNKINKFWDAYIVRANDVEDAIIATKWRLNEETDDCADGYDIVTINKVKED